MTEDDYKIAIIFILILTALTVVSGIMDIK